MQVGKKYECRELEIMNAYFDFYECNSVQRSRVGTNSWFWWNLRAIKTWKMAYLRGFEKVEKNFAKRSWQMAIKRIRMVFYFQAIWDLHISEGCAWMRITACRCRITPMEVSHRYVKKAVTFNVWLHTDFRHPWGGGAMRIVQRRRKSGLVIGLIGVVVSLIGTGASVIGLIRDIRKDRKQESNPPLQG